LALFRRAPSKWIDYAQDLALLNYSRLQQRPLSRPEAMLRVSQFFIAPSVRWRWRGFKGARTLAGVWVYELSSVN
jgi:hypothetical protein